MKALNHTRFARVYFARSDIERQEQKERFDNPERQKRKEMISLFLMGCICVLAILVLFYNV